MADLDTVSQNLTCPLCLDVFEEAKLLNCDHSFCLNCLCKYDNDHHYILCPVCRHTTSLGPQGVTGLPSDVSVNGLVEDFNSVNNAIATLFEIYPKCTQCPAAAYSKTSGPVVVSFCYDCDDYMCDACSKAHKQLVKVFGDHKVVSVEDLVSGKERKAKNVDKCAEHKSGKRDFYCEDCKAIICHECIVVEHNVRDHTIRERADVEKEIREKVDGLVERCDAMRQQLKHHICDIERERKDFRETLDKLERDIEESYQIKRKQLEERRTELIEQAKEVWGLYDNQLDGLKEIAREDSGRLSYLSQLVGQARYGGLEGESMYTHQNLCDELEVLLYKDGPRQAFKRIKEVANQVAFKSDQTVVQVGEVGPKEWQVTKVVQLPGDEPMNGMTAMSTGFVAIGYGYRGADIVSLDGDRTRLLYAGVWDITKLSDGRILTVNTDRELHIRDANGAKTDAVFETPNTTGFAFIDSDRNDNIFVSYWDDKAIYIFSHIGGEPLKTISVDVIPKQIHTTRCGDMVVQSSDGVLVLTGEGEEVSRITEATGDLYPAVDNTDTLYVAWIKPYDGVMTLESYSLDGRLKETLLEDVRIKIPERPWYYMKCLSPNTIVFCTAGTMYVIRKSLSVKNMLGESQ